MDSLHSQTGDVSPVVVIKIFKKTWFFTHQRLKESFKSSYMYMYMYKVRGIHNGV